MECQRQNYPYPTPNPDPNPNPNADTYQGKERDVVIYRGVRSRGGGLGFLNDLRPYPYPAPCPYLGQYSNPDPGPDHVYVYLGRDLGCLGGRVLAPKKLRKNCS